jgi:hypothetical protein
MFEERREKNSEFEVSLSIFLDDGITGKELTLIESVPARNNQRGSE